MDMPIIKKDLIYETLKLRIMSGEYAPESLLPKEEGFAKQLGIGRVTLRSAFDRLAKEGKIYRIPGKGTFIAKENELRPRNCLVVLPDESPIESPMGYIMSGIEARARESYMKLTRYSKNILCSGDIDENAGRILENKFDGVFFLVTSIDGDEKDFTILKKTGLPVIMPHGNHMDYMRTGFAVMRTNEYEAFGAGVKALFNRGHRRIGTIFHSRPDKRSRGFYLEEYLSFLKGLGCRGYHSELTVYCDYSQEDISAAVRKILELPDAPTAIMCFSDFYAIHVYRVLREMKVKVPEQVAVMGYCGYPGGKFLSPPLSTVDIVYEDIGRQSVDLMEKSSEWHKPGISPPEIFTPYRVIERESTLTRRIEEQLIKAFCN